MVEVLRYGAYDDNGHKNLCEDFVMSVIAHYKMNDNAATDTIIDETGVHNGAIKDAGGTATSAAHTAANSRGVGTCLDFDGTDDYIEIADHDNFTPALTPFSISVWVYMHDATSGGLLSKYDTSTGREWVLWLNSSDVLTIASWDDSTGGFIGRQTAALTSFENQWIHLLATYDGGILTSGFRVYLNAVRCDIGNFVGGTFVAVENTTTPIWIGRETSNYADGLIDNVMIFDIILNPDQVKALYHGGHGTEIPAVIDIDRRLKRR